MLNRKNDGFLIFLFGSLIGGILGLLYAPERGYRTRRKLKRFVDDIRNNGNEKLGKVKAKFCDLCESGKDIVEGADDSSFIKNDDINE